MTLIEQYIQHLENCFEKAARKESKLIPEVHDIPGMTGEMTRHFYNNLLSMDDVTYLEIGAWAGSSSCAAMYGNKAKVTIIENFSGFGGPKESFLNNYEKYKGENDSVFIEADCFKVDVSIFRDKFNIYLWDADHSEQSHFMALDYFLPAMDDIFIYVADDWNYEEVRKGTQRAIEKNGLSVLWNKEIRLTDNNQHTPADLAKESWHNGINVFLLKK